MRLAQFGSPYFPAVHYCRPSDIGENVCPFYRFWQCVLMPRLGENVERDPAVATKAVQEAPTNAQNDERGPASRGPAMPLWLACGSNWSDWVAVRRVAVANLLGRL